MFSSSRFCISLCLVTFLAAACRDGQMKGPDGAHAGVDAAPADAASAGVDAAPADAGPVGVDATPAVCPTANSGSVNSPVASQTGSFEVVWDITPQAQNLDAAVGLTYNASTGGLGFATGVRFNGNNAIGVRNGGAYEALLTINYVAGSTYRARKVVSVPAHRYDVYISVNGGSEQTLAKDFAFRTEHQSIASINNWVVGSNNGPISACLVSLQSAKSTLYLNDLKAFPTAYGGGASTVGGRGGVVVIVNTLDYDAPLTHIPQKGSLEAHYVGGFEAAIEDTSIGPRYVIFDVSGTIDAKHTRPSNYYQTVIGIPEWFVQKHGISGKSQVIVNWDFGTYRVVNTAGYPAIEIYAAYVAGDLEELLGT